MSIKVKLEHFSNFLQSLARKWGVGNRESGVGKRYFHSWFWAKLPVGD